MRDFTEFAVNGQTPVILVVGLFCLLAAATGLRVYARAALTQGALKATWLVFAGLSVGVGIWASHYSIMLAHEHHSAGYAPGLTGAALVTAVAGMILAFSVAALTTGFEGLLAAGLTGGVVIAGTHYMAVSGIALEGRLEWDRDSVIQSVLLGVGLSTAGFFAAGRSTFWLRQAGGAAALALAIMGVHEVGLQGLSVRPDPAAIVPADLLSEGAIWACVIGLSLLVLTGGVGTAVIYSRSKQSALERLREAIEVLPAGLGFYDAEDRLVVCNRQYVGIAGFCRDSITPGVPFRKLLEVDLAHGDYPEAVGREAEWMAERLAARRSGAGAIEQRLADGRWLRLEDRLTSDGGVVTIAVDITDLKRQAEALERARQEAETANRAKSEFLANMSHEIRTPLNGVVGVADVLAGTALEPRQAEMVEIIRSSGETLERLLSDILDLARIESGRIEIQQDGFHLGDAVRAVAALSDLRAREKNVPLVVEVAAEAETRISGDMVRIKQILTNLVSNAVKFTDAGEVRLSVERVEDGEAPLWRFTVRDTGVGFDPTNKDRIFGRFQQADGSITRRFGGTGLGLAISRQLAELMEGELDCDSTPGFGSVFTFEARLPVLAQEEAAADAGPAPTDAIEAEERPLRVLLADDHPTNRKVVELILAQAGVELTSVENGQEAVDAFRAGRFDVVLMDMQMPVMDGLTATRALRGIEAAQGMERAPVFMLTANALPEHVEACRAAGADRHLTKPISAPVLLQALAEASLGSAAEAEQAAA
ncbi:MAG TPA: ATP-binding protein [Caulobacteraceae bacterium]|nr:ATP-binding protein [Caulobacteraceae bacterium]